MCHKLLSIKNLVKWQKWDHGQAKVYCRKCAKASNKPFNFKQHMEQLFPKVAGSQRETSIPCPRCAKIISLSTSLSRQVWTHQTLQAGHDWDTWACTMCGVWLTMKHWSKKHYSNMYPFEFKMYPCVLCAAKISSRKELDKHNRAEHVGERAFLCSNCTNAF